VESIPHKLEPNQTHKNTFYFYAYARNRAPILPDRAPKVCSLHGNVGPIYRIQKL